MSKNKIVDVKNSSKRNDYFELTENFDGKININNKKLYFNLKFVCDSGGAQTRSLREVYHFIKCEIAYLQNNKNKTYFINILDGDEAFKNYNKFNFLLKDKKYDKIKKYIFIGDLFVFQKWFDNLK